MNIDVFVLSENTGSEVTFEASGEDDCSGCTDARPVHTTTQLWQFCCRIIDLSHWRYLTLHFTAAIFGVRIPGWHTLAEPFRVCKGNKSSQRQAYPSCLGQMRSGIRIRISGLIRIRMSAGSVAKCCGFILLSINQSINQKRITVTKVTNVTARPLSAWVISPSIVNIGLWFYEKCW